jgi:ElaB/YqjD/DUF883 family membrane-anchored ribosome-binding protein
MRTPSRAAALSLLVLGLPLLGSCSAAEPEAATPTGPDASEWADGVCTSLEDLITDIRAIGAGLNVELGNGDALEQVTTQLRSDVEAVGTSLDAVLSAVGDAPGTDDAEDLRDALLVGSGDVTSAMEDARDAAEEAADATSVAEFLASAGAALTATSSALSAAESYAESVGSAAAAADDTLREAFADAESCAALSAMS